jgi:hypothetical protein
MFLNGLTEGCLAAQFASCRWITPVGKIPTQLMPLPRGALSPTAVGYLMGGDIVSRGQRKV